MATTVARDPLEEVARTLLAHIGEDPDREGLRETPRRWAAWWRAFTGYDAGTTDTTFSSQHLDQMVVVSGMRVWSVCEHHLLPFWCDVAVGYIARERTLGLSKFARIAHQCAHRLQLQERLVEQVADEIGRRTQSADVAVVARGEHLCMTMRGIQTPHLMTSSTMRGCFLDKPEARAEFLRLALP